MKTTLTYRQLIGVLVLFSLLVSLIIVIFTSRNIKDMALNDLAQIDAKKTSEFIFQSLYSGMEKGWSSEDIDRIINRLNKLEPGLKVNVYRSEKVAEKFGEKAADKTARESDVYIKKAMNGADTLIISDEKDQIRYVYPIVAKDECLRCHTNESAGTINGAIDISYPATNLKVSLSFILNYFLIFFIAFVVFIYAIIYYNVNRYIVSPIINFSKNIHEIIGHNKFHERIKLNSRIEEIRGMEKNFNKLLDSEQKYYEKQREQYFTDSITNLPNRLRLKEAIGDITHPALMLLNIDSFKEINDFFGIKTGDFVLIELGKMIMTLLHEGEKLFKFTGDEYAILLDGEHIDKGYLEKRLSEIIDEIDNTNLTTADAQEINISLTGSACIGLDNIFENTDMALKLAKKNKKAFIVYDNSIKIAQQYENNIKWTKIIKDALLANRVKPYFQPIVCNESTEAKKYECLIRVIDENGKVIAPVHFLDVAKKSKLYCQLTAAVLKESLDAFKDTDYQFSINLSVEDILDKDTKKLIEESVQAYPHSQNIVFELLESEGIENFEEVAEFIRMVKSFGCKIAIDDFGTGYSNFAYLMQLEVDFIKIDATMIKHIDTDRNSQMVTETIVNFARKMGIETIAEFVHSKAVYDKVKELGIDYSQGYFLGEPSPVV